MKVQLSLISLLVLGAACGGADEAASNDTSVLASSEAELMSQLAPASCQCTTYVNNRFNLGGGYPNAQDWGPYLTSRGYVHVYSPQVGDVVVYTAARMNNCCGHVGVIHGVSSAQLTVRGANQTGSPFTEHNCTNVTQINFNRRSDGESYYRR